MPESNADIAAKVAERVRAAVEQHEWVERAVTISLGVALSSDQDDNVASILKRSDQALYSSKEAGRNRVTLSELDSIKRAA